ncbi:MAG TPA: protein kinase [Ktedonobacteraceae bacterium]|nr:protein kinase [Ktedonobacteraceae bacterium]
MSGLAGMTLGRYYLIESLGSGGMSEVYLAHDELMNRDVAIKVVMSNHTDYLERFRREAEAVGNLNHDHILPAYDYGIQEPWHYLVMPYIPYTTLHERLLDGPLSLEEAGEMLDQIAGALQFAHDNGVIHRDIKPANILLRDDHHAYLADFGLAKAMEGGDTITQMGILMGTPEYMAPDLADGPATISSDIYALGILLYEMVTGQVPFTAETPMAVYWKQIRDEPPPPSHFNPTIPAEIDAVILHSLDKSPKRRFQTAQELADTYREVLAISSAEEAYSAPASDNVAFYDTPEPMLSPLAYTQDEAYARVASGQPQPIILPADPTITSVEESYDTPPPVTPFAVEPEHYLDANHAANMPVTPYPVPQRRILRRRMRERSTKATRIIITGVLITIVLPLSIIYAIYLMHTAAAGTVPNGQSTSIAQLGQTHAAATRQVQATTTAGATRPVALGPVIFSDDLAHNTNNLWAEDPTSCRFSAGSYQVAVTQANFLQPCPLALPLDNVVVQVDATLHSGYNIGTLVRLKGEQFYDFEINNQRQFFFRRHDSGANDGYYSLIKPTFSPVIAPVGAKNTLLISANGDHFKLYINGTFVGEVQDSTYATGEVALATGTLDPITTAEASFANFKLYKTS